MKSKAVLSAVLFFVLSFGLAQVKIGDNPQDLHPASLLELESGTKTLVIPRLSAAQMQAITPLPGALAYNTETQCIHYFDGNGWKNICDGVAGVGAISFTDQGNGTYTFTDAAGNPTQFSNTTNVSLQIGNGELVLTDSDGNQVSTPLESLREQNFSTIPVVNTNPTISITQQGNTFTFEVGLDAIRSENIVNGGINGIDLQNESVGEGKLAPASVGASELQQNSVGSSELIDNSIMPIDFYTDANQGNSVLATTVLGDVTWIKREELGGLVTDNSLIGDGNSPNPLGLSPTLLESIAANTQTGSDNNSAILANTATLNTLQQEVLAHNGADQDLSLENELQNLSQVLSRGQDANGNSITNLSNPAQPQDAATKNYVDTAIGNARPTVVSGDPTNSLITGTDGGAFFNSSSLQTGITSNTELLQGIQTDLSNHVGADQDTDPNNEMISGAIMEANVLVLTEGGQETRVDLGQFNNVGSDNQQLSLTGTSLSLQNGGTVPLAQFLDNTDAQELVTNGNPGNIGISNGNTITLNIGDPSNTNEIQTLELNNNQLSLSKGGGQISLPTGADGAITQVTANPNTMALVFTSVNNGFSGSVPLEALVDEAVSDNNFLKTEVDGSTTNETITSLSLNNNILTLVEGGTTHTQDLGSLGGGGSDGVISQMATNGTNLEVTGTNGGFNGSIPLEGLVDAAVANNGYLTTEGDADPTNELELPAGGTSGQVLTTNGNGVYSWATVSGGGGLDTFVSGGSYGLETLTLTGNGSAGATIDLSELTTEAEMIDYTTWTNVSNKPTLLDLDYTDDFDGNWASLSGIPAELLDGDQDTQYTAGSGLTLTGTTFSFDGGSIVTDWDNLQNIPTNLDLDATDDFDGAWASLSGVPAELLDGDQDTQYTAGSGLTLSGTTFSFDGGSIVTDWDNIQNIPTNLDLDATDDFDGNWTSLSGIPTDLLDGDQDTQYTAGSGLTLSGTEFSFDGGSIVTDWDNLQNIPTNIDLDATDDFDGAWASLSGVPAELLDGDQDTQYTAGSGLTLTGTTFSFDGGSIVTDWANLQNIPTNIDLDATDDFDGTWGSLSGVPAELLDGDQDTQYTAGSGLTLTGTTFSFDGGSIVTDWGNLQNIPTNIDLDATDDFDGAWASLSGIPAELLDGDQDTQYTAGSGLTLSGTTFSFDGGSIVTDWDNLQNIPTNIDLDATDDFDGTWGSLIGVPAELLDGDQDTQYTAGSGLTLSGTEFSFDGGSIVTDWTNIQNIPPNIDLDATDDFDGNWANLSGVPTDLLDGDQDTQYTAGSGLTLTGTTFSFDGGSIVTDWDNIQNIPTNIDLDATDDFDGTWASLSGIPNDLLDGDQDTQYTAGSGLTLSGTEFSFDGGSIVTDWTNIQNIPTSLDLDVTDDFDGEWTSLNGIPSDIQDGDDDTTYTAGTGLVLNGTEFALSAGGGSNPLDGVSQTQNNTYDLNGHNLVFDGSGNVGIGNLPATPQSKLDVAGQIQARGGFAATAGTANQPSIGFYTNGDSNTGMFRAAADQIGFSTGGTEAVRIDASQNVGIGVNPTERLHVNGNILATGTITPDYVFYTYYHGDNKQKPTYRFMSLPEVEAYTRKHKHLPGVPSAGAIQEQGGILINRATEINLEKIEELFLHSIAQQKQLDSLKQENKALKNQLDQIQKDLQDLKSSLIATRKNQQ